MTIRFLFIVMSLTLVGCSGTYYIASDTSISKINVYDAQNLLKESLCHLYEARAFTKDGKRISIDGKIIPSSIIIRAREFSFDVTGAFGGASGTFHFKFDQKNIIQLYDGDASVHLYDDQNSSYSCILWWRKKDLNTYAKQFVDAFYIIKNKKIVEKLNQELEIFKTIAEKYRGLSPKPSMSEEQRKYMIQAESVTEEKKYDQAIEIYEKTVKTDPTFPKAHFNLSLVLAQVERYDEAIIEMKKYLLLVPEASNARAAQDKIYEWETK